MIILLLILQIIFILFGLFVYRYFYKPFKWTHPLVYTYLIALLDYFIRTFRLLIEGHSEAVPQLKVTETGVAIAFSFIVMAFLMRIIFYKRYSVNYLEKKEKTIAFNPKYLKAFRYLAYPMMFCIFYVSVTGGFTIIHRDAGGSSGGFIVGSLMPEYVQALLYFVIFLGVYCYKYQKSRRLMIEILVLLGLLVLKSIITTSKGNMLIVFFIIMISSSILKIKLNLWIFAPITLAFMLAYSQFSYYLRLYSELGGKFDLSVMIDNVTKFKDNINDTDSKKSVWDLLDRYYYLDPIIYMEQVEIDKSVAPYGSIQDLKGVIPKALYPNKDKFRNFGVYAGYSIWGLDKNDVVEMPIGRLAELYYLFGWIGWIFVPILVFIMNLFVDKMLVKGDIIKKAMFLNLMLLTLAGDSGWLTYYIRYIIIGLIVVMLLEKTCNPYNRLRISKSRATWK